MFDAVVVLDLDAEELERRLDQRAPDEFGARTEERQLIRRLHRTREDLPRDAILIDATRPLPEVVDEVVAVATSAAQ